MALSAEGCGHRPPEPSLERRYQLYPKATWLFYLVAILDWYSRKVLAWRLSDSMDADLCVEALKEPLTKHGKLGSFNTDQGS